MKHLKSINEFLDPMGKWTPDPEDNDGDINDPKYSQFCGWLCGKGFDFYDGQEDFKNKWIEITSDNSSGFLPEFKAAKLTNYLDEKWGLYDGAEEVLNYLKNLLEK